MDSEKGRLARAVGLREFDTPALEDVDRRRAQLWLLSLVVGLSIPAFILALGLEVLPESLESFFDLRVVRLSLLAMLITVFGYVAEREVALRRLTRMLVDERVLTAALVARVNELDMLLAASKAMNSSLELPRVLDVILNSAYELLKATEGSIMLVCPDDPTALEVVAVRGGTRAVEGQRQQVGEGIAGAVARTREALLVLGDHESSRRQDAASISRNSPQSSALVVPMEVRGGLVGVLNLAVGPDREPFNEFHLRSVAVFAETAAAAIANARAHEAVEQTVETLNELDRMKDEFLAMVTHELRTPLTAIIGIATTIQKGATHFQPNQIADLADLAREQGWRLDRLVGDLLQTARAQQGKVVLKPSRVDAARVVATALSSFMSRPGHRLSLDLPAEPLMCHIDPDALARIAVNLVDNAVKHTPAGTKVDVSLRTWAEGVALTVADDGPGIAPEERDDVFGKFRQGAQNRERPAGGLGLGLHIVRSLADAHGGRAALADGSDGCRFVVTLAEIPVSQDADMSQLTA